MALPAATTGTGGWGLAPVGTASQSTMPLAPQTQSILTPEQIAQLRQQSVVMQAPPTQNIQSWTQGVAELVRAMQGNREADFARNQELQGRQQGAEAIGKIYAPYLSPGGSSPSAAGAAPAGTLGSGPAGATASADSPAPSDTSTPTAAAPATPAATADASAPRGIRNNNPLNIEDGQFARGQPGYAGSDGRFAKFETPEHGVSAANSLLSSYQTNQGLNTINGIVGRWAPSTDGNNTKAYAAHVAAQMGIGPDDPIPPAMRPQLIAAMAAHENGVPLPPAATKVPQAASPTGLLAPIQPPSASPPAIPPSPAAPSPAPTQLAYAGTGPIPPGMVPNPVTQGAQGQPASPPGMAPMVNAIAGRPMPPAAPTPPPVTPAAPPIAPPDFVRQAAAMEAAKASAPQPPLPSPGAAIPPADFAAQVAAMEAAKGAPNQPASGTPPIAPADFAKMAATMEAMKAGAPASPPSGSAAPPTQTAAIPPTPPIAAAPPPATPLPPAFLPTGSAIPGAVGPTSVNGTPLAIPPPFGATSVNGAQLPQRVTPPANAAPLVNAIAGQNLPPNAAPTAGTGLPIPGAPPQVAQNVPPPSAAPSPAGGPAGLPSPLTSPTGQVTQAQLTQVLANPWVPESAKAAMLQMIQQRGQPQSMPVEGGTLMFNAAGQKVFIPEPKMGTVKIGGAEIPTVSHFDPASGRWNTQTLAPGGGVQTGAPSSDGGGPMPHPAQAQGGTPQPDLSTIGGIQAAEAAQAGAKKGAETSAETSAKYYDSLHKGLAGSAMIASQQKQNIDALRQIASSPDFISGAFGDSALQMQRFAAQLGINPTGAAPRELFNQLAAKVLADQFSGLKSMASETGEAGGRVFKPMLDIEEKANVTSDDTPAGINAKLNLLDNAGNLMMHYGDMADDYVKEHGKLDAGFDKSLRGEIAKSRLPNVVPQPETGAAASAPVTKAIGGKTYYQIGGKWFDNPDGK